MSYTAKYQEGAITNSMLEAAEACGLKFWMLYIKRQELESIYDKILDSLSLGILVHNAIEQYPQVMSVAPVSCVLKAVQDWHMPNEMENLLFDYMKAIDLTIADGMAKGRTYTAPTWTNYWKQNFTILDNKAEAFNAFFKAKNWLCDIEPFTYLVRATTCMQNYKTLLPQINAGLIYRSSEQTFHLSFQGETLAGTIDRDDEDPTTGGQVITDFKTGNKKYDSQILHNLNQLQLYALAKRMSGIAVTGFRIVAVERNEVVTVPFNEKAHRIFVEDRLPRLIHNVKILRNTPKELLPVLAGRSFSLGCPCGLAQLKPGDPNRCTATYLEG